MAIKTTLKTKNTGETLYPQTVADIVYTLDSDATGKKLTVEQKLQNIENKLSEVEQASDYKGYFPNETALLNKWNNSTEENPLTHEQSLERKGWYARVGADGSADTTMYYWDVEDKAWIKGAIVNINGVTSVNNLQPDENTGNVTLTAENIPTAFTTEQGINKSTQEVFNDLQLEHNQLEDEIEVLQNKTSVLYLTNSQLADAINRLVEPYANGQVVVCNDDGDYKLGSSYKFIIEGTEETPTFRWEEITSSGGTAITDALVLSKDVVVPPLNGQLTYTQKTSTSSFVFTEKEPNTWEITSSNGGRYAVLQLTINLDRPSDLTFLCEIDGLYSHNCVVFSNIDTELKYGDTSDSVGTFYNFVVAERGLTTYHNFPEGEHKLYIKYRASNPATTKCTIKLLTPIVSSETVYVSSNSIKVDNSKELQINDKSILTYGDATPRLIGTKEEPIVLADLDAGDYYISGYFKYVNNYGNATYCVVSYVDRQNLVASEGIFAKIAISDINATKKNLFLTTACISKTLSYTENSILLDFQEQNSYGNIVANYVGDSVVTHIELNKSNFSGYIDRVKKNNLCYSYDGGGSTAGKKTLTTENTKEYIPTGLYHPATKKYVDDTVSSAKSITSVENPLIDFSSSGYNTFLNSLDTGNNQLYYLKRKADELTVTQLQKGTVVENGVCAIDKNIINGTYDGVTELQFSTKSYKSSGSTKYSYIKMDVQNGKITKIYVDSAVTASNVVYADGEWKERYNLNAEYADITTGFFGEGGITRFELSSADSQIAEYVKAIYVQMVSEPIRIALYKDIQNGGSGGGSSEVPEEVIKYYEEYNSTKTYSKNDVIYYTNHFFISVSDNNVGITPNVNAFYTMVGDKLYWRNIGYSATYATNATNDGDGNNISSTYATKSEIANLVPNTRTINGKALTSDVSIKANEVYLEQGIGTVQSSLETLSGSIQGLRATNIIYDEEGFGNDTIYDVFSSFSEALGSGLGDQVTYTLSGTTLTITSK